VETSKADARQRWRIRVLAAVTIGCTGVISFSSLRNLAEHAGFGWLSWLFPICIDCVAALGMDVWLSKSAAYRWGAGLALSAVSLSLLGNIADWWIKKGTILAALLGAVPPAALAFELFVMHRHSRGAPGAPPQLPVELTVQLAEEVWRDHHPTNQPAPLDGAPDAPTEVGAPVAPNGRVPEPAVVRPTPAPLPQLDGAPSQARVEIHGDGLPQLFHRDGHQVSPRTNGAPPQPVVQAPNQPDRPEVVHQPHVARPEEAELVQLLREHDPQGELSRRMVEEFLTEQAGETIGSSRATRMMAAARNGGA
jgi:hypothetical protein